jgi:hypothetical protein
VVVVLNFDQNGDQKIATTRIDETEDTDDCVFLGTRTESCLFLFLARFFSTLLLLYRLVVVSLLSITTIKASTTTTIYI